MAAALQLARGPFLPRAPGRKGPARASAPGRLGSLPRRVPRRDNGLFCAH